MTLNDTVSNSQKYFSMKTLRAILGSEEYKKELEDLSFYAAHIKQERPMLCIMAKHLYKLGFETILEKKIRGCAHDLVVNNTTVEAKFYYEGDIERRLEKEMDEVEWNIDSLRRELESLKERNGLVGT